MNAAMYAYDYFYRNHSGKYVCFSFESKKRVKIKVLEFIKNEHRDTKIKEYLKQFDLKLVLVHKSRKYIQYFILDSNKVVINNLYNEVLDLGGRFNLDVNYLRLDIRKSFDASIDEIFESNEWSFADLILEKDAMAILAGFAEKFEAIAEKIKRSDK